MATQLNLTLADTQDDAETSFRSRISSLLVKSVFRQFVLKFEIDQISAD